MEKQNVAVFAGAKKDDPTHAVISLRVGDPFTGLYEEEVLDAPLRGPIHLVSAENPDVKVVSESTGETAVFDADARDWE